MIFWAFMSMIKETPMDKQTYYDVYLVILSAKVKLMQAMIDIG